MSSQTAVSRRDRVREQTRTEIKAAARRLLVTDGPTGIQLRPVAREVGMTAPGLYRYFPSLEELVAAVTVDLFGELCDAMERAADPAPDPFARMLALSRAFRRWAVEHPHEFGLLFAIAPTALGQEPENPCQQASDRFGNLFALTFLQMWQESPFPVADDVDPAMAAALTPYWTWLTGALDPDLPLGAVVVYLEGWVRIFGSVATESFGHLAWAMPDGEPMFEQVMRSLADLVHRPDAYRPPATT